MRWTRTLLTIAMLQYAAFGLLALVDPRSVGRIAHLGVVDATSLNEIRAMFGGVQLALAAFFAACLANRWSLRAGLVLVTSIFVAALMGRLASIVVDGIPTSGYLGIAAFEALFAAAGLAALRRERS